MTINNELLEQMQNEYKEIEPELVKLTQTMNNLLMQEFHKIFKNKSLLSGSISTAIQNVLANIDFYQIMIFIDNIPKQYFNEVQTHRKTVIDSVKVFADMLNATVDEYIDYSNKITAEKKQLAANTVAPESVPETIN